MNRAESNTNPTPLSDSELEWSSVVANSRMNRERDLVGSNSYTDDLRFNPLEFLEERLRSREHVAWLDLCCGTGRALIQAALRLRQADLTERVSIVGIDLVSMFDRPPEYARSLSLQEATLHSWEPDRSFDLITCVHGLHYVGDKPGLICRAVSWLENDGFFIANLDLNNLRQMGGRTLSRRLLPHFRASGLTWKRQHHLISCSGRSVVQLPFRYRGADDQVGPNYTGQPAVDSTYEYVGDCTG